jgi:hypothetical protein
VPRLRPRVPFCALGVVLAGVLAARLAFTPQPPDALDRLAERLRAAGPHTVRHGDGLCVSEDERPPDELEALPRKRPDDSPWQGVVWMEAPWKGAVWIEPAPERREAWKTIGDLELMTRVWQLQDPGR